MIFITTSWAFDELAIAFPSAQVGVVNGERGVWVKSSDADAVAAVLASSPPSIPTQETPADKLAAAARALAALDNIAAPVLPTDVLDILADVRIALEG